VSWAESTVSIGLTRESVKTSPVYDAKQPLSREQETGIHTHYGRADYWSRETQ
jgi:hypothetical protein